MDLRGSLLPLHQPTMTDSKPGSRSGLSPIGGFQRTGLRESGCFRSARMSVVHEGWSYFWIPAAGRERSRMLPAFSDAKRTPNLSPGTGYGGHSSYTRPPPIRLAAIPGRPRPGLNSEEWWAPWCSAARSLPMPETTAFQIHDGDGSYASRFPEHISSTRDRG